MTVVTPLTARTPGSSRRPRVPPAIIRGSEALPALPVVDEIPGDLGVALWRSVRNVLLWSHTPPERRGMLFDAGAAAARAAELGRVRPDAELLAPLSVIVALLEAPERVEVQRLVNACRRIAAWAEGKGALGTALEYTQAAALVRPDSAGLAFAVGRLARRRAEYDRAESWYMRAIVQGRQAGDWRSYSLAFSGLGNLFMQRGNYPYARKAHVRSLRAARRHSLRDLQGDAYHALFAIHIETGNPVGADDLAEEAFAAYGPDHPKVPRLAYDVAYQWTAAGRFSVAHSLAEALVPHFSDAAELALVWGLVARTAGGAGFRSSFEGAVREARALLASERALDSAARVELGVAYGAASAGEWELAIEFADAAVRSATGRGESKVLLEAEAALDAARRRSAMQALASAGDACAPFAESLVRALSPQAGSAASVAC
jgi:tetratricopeptide (TPR) repeat protein